jgi:hypothetical protein
VEICLILGKFSRALKAFGTMPSILDNPRFGFLAFGTTHEFTDQVDNILNFFDLSCVPIKSTDGS